MVNDKYGLFKSFDENMKLRNEEVAAFADKCRRTTAFAKKKNGKSKELTIVSCICILLVAGLLFFTVRNPIKYESAQFLAEKGEYVKAAYKYYDLGDYKDSSSRLEEVMLAAVDNAEVGDKVPFGTREGGGIITWTVIDSKDGEKLLFANAQRFGYYSTRDEARVWKALAENADKWFTDAEKACLVEKQLTSKQYYCRVHKEDEYVYWKRRGELSKSYSSKHTLFLLSVDEVKSYANSYSKWKELAGTSTWLTRTSVKWTPSNATGNDDIISLVTVGDGEIQSTIRVEGELRPAMWVKVK